MSVQERMVHIDPDAALSGLCAFLLAAHTFHLAARITAGAGGQSKASEEGESHGARIVASRMSYTASMREFLAIAFLFTVGTAIAQDDKAPTAKGKADAQGKGEAQGKIEAEAKAQAKDAKAQMEKRETIAKFPQKHAANRKHLIGYRWNQRDDIYQDKERRYRRMFMMELATEDRLEKTYLGGKLYPSKKKRKKTFVDNFEDKKKRPKLLRWVEKAEQIIRDYAYHPINSMTQFLAVADLSDGTGSMEGTICATGRGFLRADDRVRIWFRPTKTDPTLERIEYHTVLQGRSISGWVRYRFEKEGKYFYPERSELRAPRKKLRLVLLNHTLQAPKPSEKDAETEAPAKKAK